MFSEHVCGLLLKVEDAVGQVGLDSSEEQQKLLHLSLPVCQESQTAEAGGGRGGGCR